MTSSRRRSAFSALALTAAAVLIAGCAQSPASPPPTSTPGQSASANPTVPGSDGGDIETAWIDDGRGFAIITWGSSTCVPVLGDVTADGQTIAVTLSNNDEKVCTDDLVPRGLFVSTPDGVDVTQDVDVQVDYAPRSQGVDLDALAEAPQGISEQQPSAGWFEDDGIALLTWGSSTCPPVIEDIDHTDAGATITFATVDRVCTMDFVPRVTAIMLPREHDDDAPFELTLRGDNLDGKVAVVG